MPITALRRALVMAGIVGGYDEVVRVDASDHPNGMEWPGRGRGAKIAVMAQLSNPSSRHHRLVGRRPHRRQSTGQRAQLACPSRDLRRVEPGVGRRRVGHRADLHGPHLHRRRRHQRVRGNGPKAASLADMQEVARTHRFRSWRRSTERRSAVVSRLPCAPTTGSVSPHRSTAFEVNIGLLPGAGGTQRLPRLIGVPKALEAMTSGPSPSRLRSSGRRPDRRGRGRGLGGAASGGDLVRRACRRGIAAAGEGA